MNKYFLKVVVALMNQFSKPRKMWMTDYIRAVKKGLRDEHGFTPREGSSEDDPVFDKVPDGEYPMTIEGRIDHVRIVNGGINCGNFD